MKYILVILICFFSLFSYGQVQKQPRSNFPTVVDSSLAIGKNFIFPVFRSFQQLSQYQVLDSTGRVVFIRDSNALFLRTNQHTWQKIASAATTGVPGGQQYSIQTNDGSGGFYGDDLLLYNNLTGNIDVNVIGTVNLKPEGYVRINAFNEPTGFSNLIFDGLTKEVAPRNGYIIGTNDTGEVVKLVANGLSGSVLTNDGNNNLSWIGGSGTSTGIDSLTVTTTSICYWIDGVPTCLPAIGAGVDSITIVGDQWCQWLGGVSNCYTISGDTIVVGSGIDSVTVTGNIICWYPSSTPGEPVCASVDNAGNYIDSASLSSDSLEYNFYSSGVFRFFLPTLLKNLYAGSGIYISDTTISGNPFTAIYGTGGGSGGTLQSAWDANPTAYPTLFGDRGKLAITGMQTIINNVYNVSTDSTEAYYRDSIDASATPLHISEILSAGYTTRVQHTGDSYIISTNNISNGQSFQIDNNAIYILASPDSSYAKLGIGTGFPSASLDVIGTTRFRGNGTPGTGKIATGTDADGNWTWQTNTSVSTTQLTDSLNKIRDSLSAHNIRIGANTTALSKITSGSYQPTITSVANLDAVSISRCLYSRTDSTAEVSGEITFDPTAGGGTLSRARFTLPITSDLNASWQCDGVAYIGVVSSIALGGVITADTTNDQAEMNFPSNFTTSQTCKFKLTYYIR